MLYSRLWRVRFLSGILTVRSLKMMVRKLQLRYLEGVIIWTKTGCLELCYLNSFVILNRHCLCKDRITKAFKKKESVIEFVLVDKKMLPFVTTMDIFETCSIQSASDHNFFLVRFSVPSISGVQTEKFLSGWSFSEKTLLNISQQPAWVTVFLLWRFEQFYVEVSERRIDFRC